jgi:prevent-host-death family protein
MRSVGVYEAKTHLPRLLDEVAKGETIVITKRGVPIAKLVPVGEARRRSPPEAIDEWIAYRDRENIRLDGLSIREMVREGRR